MTISESTEEIKAIVKSNSLLLSEALDSLKDQTAIEATLRADVEHLKEAIERVSFIVVDNPSFSLLQKIAHLEAELVVLEKRKSEDKGSPVTVKIALITAVASLLSQVLQQLFSK